MMKVRGVHPPETMMHFPPVSDFPLFSENFWTLRKIFAILLFPDKFLDFHPPKFLMTFSSTKNFEFPSYFPCFNTFPHCFAQIIISPILWQTSPSVLHKFTCFLHTLRVFRFPLL